MTWRIYCWHPKSGFRWTEPYPFESEESAQNFLEKNIGIGDGLVTYSVGPEIQKQGEKVKKGPPYFIVYADPPWPVCGEPKAGKGKTKEFPLMSYKDIADLNVIDFVADDAYLFLWIMASTLPYAPEIMKAWGFEYRGVAFAWVKTKKDAPEDAICGFGSYTRQAMELCLLGIRGKPTKNLPERAHDVLEVQTIVRAGLPFAKKPDHIRDEIVRLCTPLPRLEMFARMQPPGWDTWGNECRCDVDIVPRTQPTDACKHVWVDCGLYSLCENCGEEKNNE